MAIKSKQFPFHYSAGTPVLNIFSSVISNVSLTLDAHCTIYLTYPRITFSGVANFDAESKIQVSTRERQKFQYHSGQVKKNCSKRVVIRVG